MCKKQTSVSHSSTESEVASLDAGLRMDGISALDLWDVVIEILHSSQNTHHIVRDHRRKEKIDDQVQRSRACGEIRSTNPNTMLKRSGNRDVDGLSNVDHVVTNASSSQPEVQLYIFEESEGVIEMIRKCRSPTMRDVSRTHGVALDSLFDRVNLDPQNPHQTKNQLTDMLTKGSFTRDEWNHLFRSLNIMNFMMFSCSHFLSLKEPNTMSKKSSGKKDWRRACGGKI